MKITQFAVCLLFATSVAAASAEPFHVRCELGGEHGADSDRIGAREEIELLRAAIEDVYPLLPGGLQEVSRKIVFSISHSEKAWTKLVMGWGPEDDADYRYPDTKLYPEGTIKVSFSEKTMQAMALGVELSKSNPQAGAGARNFSRYIIAHELTHAFQYRRSPLQDLLALHRQGDGASNCRDGLLDDDLMAHAEKRLEYERAAYAAHRDYIDRPALLAFTSAIEARERARPSEFAAGGKYHLLASEGRSPFIGKLREEASMVGHGGEFGPLAKFPNEGQVVPSAIVRAFARLNDEVGAATDTRGAAIAAVPRAAGLRARWDAFMTGDNFERVKKFLPCKSEDIAGRYRAETVRFESFLRSGYAVTER